MNIYISMHGEAEQKEPSPTPCLGIVSISYNTMDQRLIDVANTEEDVDGNTMDDVANTEDDVDANTLIDVASTEDDVDANTMDDVANTEDDVNANTMDDVDNTEDDVDANTLIDVASTGDDVDANTMDQRLIHVANTGNVNDFYTLLGEDKFILEHIDLAPFVDTPLHIAIVAEKTNLAVEIANLKPSFARKLNQAGLSPIHLASTQGNLKIVCDLLDKDHDLCLLAGRGKRLPLHFAAEAGKVDVMIALLKHCPGSIGMLTVREETPLHLAAKNGEVEACKVLLKWIKKLNRWELTYWTDEDGKTALDVAASGSPEMVELSVKEKFMLENNFLFAKAKRKVKAWILEKPVTNDSRSAMLVVLALIITATFQAVVSPPGGVWQDTTTAGTAENQPAHEAGKAVMGRNQYIKFANINSFGFCASIVAITLLTIDIPFIFQLLLMCCIGPMMIIYHAAVTIITPGEYRTFEFMGRVYFR